MFLNNKAKTEGRKTRFPDILRTWLLFPIILFTLKVTGQQINVEEATGTIRERIVKGHSVCIELDVKTVESGLSRFVRSLGKFDKAERNAWQSENLMVPALASDAVDFFAKMTVSPRCIQVFMGALRSGTKDAIQGDAGENLRKMLYDFSLELYRSDIRRQITEAERVVNLAVKAHDKRSREGDDLKDRLKRNRREKIRLLEEIDQNARNLQLLLGDSVRNAAEKETALEEIQKVRKIAEERKQKLGVVR
jgi:hypothetical protein